MGKTYSIDYKTGFLLVAYPDMGKATDFEFTYKTVATAIEKESEESEETNFVY